MERIICNTSINFNDIVDKEIFVFGTKTTPYFCAKNCADTLEYKDTSKAIRMHVSNKNKMSMTLLREKFNESDAFQTIPPLIGNEGASMWINEAGLYELIFTSKMKNARIFKDWIFESVLPQIRRGGKYQLIKYSTDSLKNHLSKIKVDDIGDIDDIDDIGDIESKDIDDIKSSIEITPQVPQNIKIIKKSITELENNIDIKNLVKINDINPQNDGYVCISTTDLLKMHNLFKIHYALSLKNEKKYYHMYILQVPNAKMLVSCLQKILGIYSYVNEKNIFCLPYNLLLKHVDNICNTSANIKVEYMSANFKEINLNTCAKLDITDKKYINYAVKITT